MARSVATVDDKETVRLALKDFLCEDLFNFCYDDEPPFSSSDIASSRAAEQPSPTSTTTNSNSFVPLSSSHSCQIEPTPLTSSTYIPKPYHHSYHYNPVLAAYQPLDSLNLKQTNKFKHNDWKEFQKALSMIQGIV